MKAGGTYQMSFPESEVLKAWQRAGGCCECERTTHTNHKGKCSKTLSWANRGREGWGAWEAHHRVAGGPDVASNCEILCWDCHKQTPTFGHP
jgi:hypothetical protein